MKYKVGDKVLLKNRRGYNWNYDGKMDKYMGQIVTIRGFAQNGTKFYIEKYKRDRDNWIFALDDIENKIEEISDLLIFN